MMICDLCDQLAAEFDVTQQQCEQDVITHVQELLARGLVQVVTEVGGALLEVIKPYSEQQKRV